MADRKVVVDLTLLAGATLPAVIGLTPGPSERVEKLIELYRNSEAIDQGGFFK